MDKKNFTTGFEDIDMNEEEEVDMVEEAEDDDKEEFNPNEDDDEMDNVFV